MRVIILIILALVACHSVSANPISYTDLLSRPHTSATEKIPYGNLPDQFGELWLPKTNTQHPLVIMIHGGCWQESLPGVELMALLAEDLQRSGIAVWNIEYRRLGATGGGYPGTFLDIAQAIDKVQQLATPYHLDLSHIVIVGHSAGASLGLWAAARHKFGTDSIFYAKNPLPIKSVISLAGIDDLTIPSAACGGTATIDALITATGHSGAKALQDTSPAALLPLGVNQIIVSGSLDPIVPFAMGENYGRMAQASGDKVKIITIPDSGHFELIDPQSSAWQIIKQNLLERLQNQ